MPKSKDSHLIMDMLDNTSIEKSEALFQLEGKYIVVASSKGKEMTNFKRECRFTKELSPTEITCLKACRV